MAISSRTLSLASLLIQVDRLCDRLPVISTITNLIDIFQKRVWDCRGWPDMQANRYYTYLKTKSYARCAILLIPGVGNLLIAVYDCFKGSQIGGQFSRAPINPENQPIETASSYRPSEQENAMAFNARIFQETLQACQRGYRTPNQVVVHLNHEPMLRGTMTYDQIERLPPVEHKHQTLFTVFAEDTFQVLLRRKEEGKNPVGINMANRYRAGGGVVQGCPAQEEALCRRSNHYLGLKTQAYPLPEMGGAYCPHVQVFREDGANGFAFMDHPAEVALVAVAAYDLRGVSSDRSALGLSFDEQLDESVLQNSIPYIEGTKSKIRHMLRIMALKGHTHLVLGALGCGAFENPPGLVSRLFVEVFQEAEFNGRFECVDFAILRLNQKDQNNVDAFTQACAQLNV